MLSRNVFLLLFVVVVVTSGENVTISHSSQQPATSNEITEPYLNKQFVNETNSYSAQHQPKLLMAGAGNNTLVNSQARTVVVGTGNDVKANPTTTAAANTTSLILILVSLVLITCIILLIITALFIMRRRFSIWRLNNSKLNLNGDNGAAGGSENAEEESESKQEMSAGGDTVKSDTAAVICDENEQPTVAPTTTETSKQAVIELDAPAVAEANCHLNQAVETGGETTTTMKATATNDTPVLTSEHVSSTSLIVNVLNELSESVAKGLATKSPTSRSSLTNDPEKQPLNE